MKKNIIAAALIIVSFISKGQEINPLYDLKKFHFGFNILFNTGKFKYSTASNYFDNRFDTLQEIQAVNYPNFGLGGLVNIRLNDYMDLRSMLNIQFAQRNMVYKFKGGEEKDVKVESTYMEIPVYLKLKSKRHNNLRFYVFGGATFRHDFASDIDTDRSDTKPVLGLRPNTFSYDVGFGFDIYYEYFKFSPEFKISNTIGNILVNDPFLYASSLNAISPKLIQISLCFE